eukprot:gene33772-31204_t
MTLVGFADGSAAGRDARLRACVGRVLVRAGDDEVSTVEEFQD